MEVERHAVHAIAQAGRFRTVVKDVAKVAATTAAMHFGAGHEKAAVSLGLDRLVEWCQKLGQPVPLSNLLLEAKSGCPQPAQ